jgi:hypothetical protein
VSRTRWPLATANDITDGTKERDHRLLIADALDACGL